MSRARDWLYRHQRLTDRTVVFLAFIGFCVMIGLQLHDKGQKAAYATHLAREDGQLLKDYAHQVAVNRLLDHRTQLLAQKIQASRLADCRQGNRNHAATFKVLRPETRKALAAAKTPAQRTSIEATVKIFDRLFDASVPQHNCRQFVSSS